MNEIKLTKAIKVLLLTILKRGTLKHDDARELLKPFGDGITKKELQEAKKMLEEML